jgi:hypothetical protein
LTTASICPKNLLEPMTETQIAPPSQSPPHDEPAPRPEARVSAVGRSARHWFFEGTLIVVSVLLGFGLSELREAQAERELTGRVLDGIRAEIEYNLSVLEPFVPMHAQWMQALAKVDTSEGDQTGLEVWFATRPPLPLDGTSPFPSLRRSAWDAAVAGGALRLVDYDIAAALADVYGMQEQATANVQRLATGALSTPAVYEATSRPASVRLLWLTLADIQSAEALLLSRYREHLPAVTAAASTYQ